MEGPSGLSVSADNLQGRLGTGARMEDLQPEDDYGKDHVLLLQQG